MGRGRDVEQQRRVLGSMIVRAHCTLLLVGAGHGARRSLARAGCAVHSPPGGCLLQLLHNKGTDEALPCEEKACGCSERRWTASLGDTGSNVQREVLRGALAHFVRLNDTVCQAPVTRAAGSCSGLATRRRGQSLATTTSARTLYSSTGAPGGSRA